MKFQGFPHQRRMRFEVFRGDPVKYSVESESEKVDFNFASSGLPEAQWSIMWEI